MENIDWDKSTKEHIQIHHKHIKKIFEVLIEIAERVEALEEMVDAQVTWIRAQCKAQKS